MKRLALLLFGFWAVLGAALVLVILISDDTPAPKEKPPGPMTCASLQKRAEKCADGLADLAGNLYALHLRQQGESEFAIGTKRPFVATVVFGAISEKKVALYCKRYWKSDSKRIQKVKVGLAACFAKPGCEPFVGCVRRLAQKIDFTSF